MSKKTEQDRVEEAEDTIFQGYLFNDLKEAQDFINGLQKDHKEWWGKNLDQIRKVTLVLDKESAPKEKDKVAMIKAQQQGFEVTITVSDDKKLQEFPLVSNLVRMNLPDNGNLNGEEYRKLVLLACKEFLDDTFYEELRDAFVEEGLSC